MNIAHARTHAKIAAFAEGCAEADRRLRSHLMGEHAAKVTIRQVSDETFAALQKRHVGIHDKEGDR